jgi:acetylornithine/LysW-gamma-L-lysine aminotransferase
MPRGGHGSTFAGNPLVCAAGLVTVEALADVGLHEHVCRVGALAMERLHRLRLSCVREVRGRGLMIGIELRHPVAPAIRALQHRGVLVLPAGRTVIRMLPPLIIDDAMLSAALDIIVDTITELGAAA